MSLFADLLAAAKTSAIHLELRDQYMQDDPDLHAWRTGHRPDPADRATWWRDWLQLPADAVARGVSIRRLRVVSEPISEYIHYEYDGTFTNIAVGEDIRWLPRPQALGLLLPVVDFWVFDGSTAIINHLAGDGSWGDGETEGTDPALVATFVTAFEAAWERGIPHADYQPRLRS
ncbi:MAG: hypothetical protein QG608_3326 [Actinomycetota bacterium]|nr:hypothetical protein [Actinomycetota bacterium]